MSFKPVFTRYLKIPALLFAVLICALPLTRAHGQETKKLKITVTLVDHEGKAVAGANVIIRRDGETNPNKDPLDPIEGQTDAKGVFPAYSLKNGYSYFQLFEGKEHKIVVTPPGDSPVAVERVLSNQELSDAVARDNGPGVLNVSMALPAPPKKTKVLVTGFVRDEQDKPIQNAQVVLTGEAQSADASLGEKAKGTTNKEGKFEIVTDVRLEGKPHQLSVNAPGFKPDKREIKDDDLLRQGSNGVLEQHFKLSKVDDDGGHPILASLALLLIGAAFGFGGPVLYRQFWSKEKINHQHAVVHELRRIAGDVDAIRTAMLTKLAFQQEIKSAIQKTWVELGLPSGTAKTDGAAGAGQSGTNTPEIFERSDGLGYENRPNPLKSRDPLPQDAETLAFMAYRNLIDKIPNARDPIYLDVEVPRSAAGKLEDNNVYLSQVSSSRGALVLFSDGGSVGWVFPNPKVALRFVAIKDVFPDLNELDYDLNKENVDPKPVRKLEEGRWLVLRN